MSFTQKNYPINQANLALQTRRGQSILIRHIRPGDAELLVEFFGHLSPETRRMRFMTNQVDPPEELVWQQAARLAAIDPQREAALVATVEAAGSTQIVGVARLGCESAGALAAEAAIVLRDDYQGQGLGSCLFDLLLQLAMARGIEQIWLLCLAENTGMQRLVQKSGLPYTTTTSRGETTMTIELVGHSVLERAAGG